MHKLTIDDIKNMGLEYLRDDFEDEGWASVVEGREYCGYNLIGRGMSAVVFQKEGQEHVLRISRAEDAWPHYAVRVQGEEHGPQIEALGYHDGFWIAVVEELEPLSTLEWQRTGLEELASAMFSWGGNIGPFIEQVETICPGVPNFILDHLQGATDIMQQNVMRRGETIVFNDPYCEQYSEAHPKLKALAAKWKVDSAAEPELSW